MTHPVTAEELSGAEKANENRVRTLIEKYGVPVDVVHKAALQVRIEQIVKRTIGDDPRFELEYEQVLGAVLDDVYDQIVEASKLSVPESKLVLP